MSKQVLRLGLAAAALVVAAGGLLWTAPSDAALPPRPPLPPDCNSLAAMEHLISFFGAPPSLASTPGSISADIGSTFTTSDGRQGVEVRVTDLQSAGVAEGIGEVNLQFDPTRDPGPSSVVANQRDSMFPATQRMNLFITVGINGRQFRSIDRVTLISTNVTSIPPAVGTTFDLANEVQFEAVDNPGEVAMTMEPSRAAVITGHPEG